MRSPARLIPSPAMHLAGEVGRLVHVATDSNPAFVYRLLRVDGESAFLETPKTRRGRSVSVRVLCYTRKREPMRRPWTRASITRRGARYTLPVAHHTVTSTGDVTVFLPALNQN